MALSALLAFAPGARAFADADAQAPRDPLAGWRHALSGGWDAYTFWSRAGSHYTSQVRIPGFGGSSILQYSTPATFVGELSGTVRIGVSSILSPLTEIDDAGYADLAGAGVAGLQSTKVNISGNGYMYGTLDFVFRPVDPLAPVTGTVSYGVSGGGEDSIQLTAGLVTGGGYQVAVDGGSSGRVDGVELPPPSTATVSAFADPARFPQANPPHVG